MNGNILVNFDIYGTDTKRGIFQVNECGNLDVTKEVDIAASDGKLLLEVNDTKAGLGVRTSIFSTLVNSCTLCLREIEHG